MVELRDQLRERAELARQPKRASRRDLRRRYSDEQLKRALELIAEGKTLKRDGLRPSARPGPESRNRCERAGVQHAGPRRYSPTEIRHAVALVRDGRVTAPGRQPRRRLPTHGAALGAQGRMTSRSPPAITPELLGELAARAGRPDFPRLEAQLRSSGYCARPVRLQGTIETCDGHGRRRVWSTDTEPDGILRKACGNRREAVCPPCAERYRQDAYHLIAAGLQRRQGRPGHDRRAPGRVRHADGAELRARAHAPARPGRGAAALPAAPRRAGLPARRAAVLRRACTTTDDPCLGEPLCPECFDHAGAVVWNNALGELWRRTHDLPAARAGAAGRR